MKKSTLITSLNTLIIFDYSGTLSRHAPLFSRPDNLQRHLENSGLKDVGIESPSIFWEQLVNPTWEEGSTTSAGYKQIMEKQIRTLLSDTMAMISSDRISKAVSSFVDSYFRHSNIDRKWTSVLQTLYRNHSIITIIATDHYAEATGFIIKFLRTFRIRAITANEALLRHGQHPFVVANSADMGVHKTDPRFWEILKSRLNLENIQRILIVDDFGYHEQQGDRYADRQKVAIRKNETVRVLKSVFRVDIEVIPFMMRGGDLSKDERYTNLVAESSLAIQKFLFSDINKQGDA